MRLRSGRQTAPSPCSIEELGRLIKKILVAEQRATRRGLPTRYGEGNA